MTDQVQGERERFEAWCRDNPRFNLDPRMHTHGRDYMADETTRIAFAAWQARASLGAGESAPAGNEWTPKDPEAAFWRDRFNECAPYLKEDETPLQRIERDHRDMMALLRLLAAEKIKNESLMSAATGNGQVPLCAAVAWQLMAHGA